MVSLGYTEVIRTVCGWPAWTDQTGTDQPGAAGTSLQRDCEGINFKGCLHPSCQKEPVEHSLTQAPVVRDRHHRSPCPVFESYESSSNTECQVHFIAAPPSPAPQAALLAAPANACFFSLPNQQQEIPRWDQFMAHQHRFTMHTATPSQ